VDPLDSIELQRVLLPEEERRLRPLGKVAAALAAAALVVIATAPGLWDRTAGMLAPPVTDPPAGSGLASPQRETPSPSEARTVPGASPSAASQSRANEPEAPAARAVSQRVPADLVATPGRTDPSADAQQALGLTEDAFAYSPSFASVGSAFFYHTRADGPSALVRADTDTSGAVLKITRIVNDSARNFHARPSPDGTRIAFDSDREGVRAVFIADADGKRVRRISADGFAAIPSWSPDGETLAYIRAEENRPRVWNIWITDLANGATRRVTNYRVGQPWGASWFPDGRRIAYSHEDRLIVRDLETGMERVYPSPRKGRLVRTPAVSPDGRRVIFQVHRDGAWLLDVEDGAMRKVLADPSAEEYAWSPDGRRIAYHSRESGEWGVWLMAPHQ
jgi:Tol biopolymer transport system component